MPNIDLLTIVKWLVILAIAVGVVGVVASQLGIMAGAGKSASVEAFDQPVSGAARMGYVEGSGNPHTPTLEHVGVLMLDAVLGEGTWATVIGWVAGGVVTALICFIAWGLWKAIAS